MPQMRTSLPSACSVRLMMSQLASRLMSSQVAVQRVAGDQEAERLLLEGQFLLVVPLRQVGQFHAAAVAPGHLFGAEQRYLGAGPLLLDPLAKPVAGSSPSIRAARVAPVESKAPHLISDSITRLLTRRRSTRSQKSYRAGERPPAPCLQDGLDGPGADVLDRPQAEADGMFPTTVKESPEALMSGGSTSMPMFAAVADVLDDLVGVVHVARSAGRP